MASDAIRALDEKNRLSDWWKTTHARHWGRRWLTHKRDQLTDSIDVMREALDQTKVLVAEMETLGEKAEVNGGLNAADQEHWDRVRSSLNEIHGRREELTKVIDYTKYDAALWADTNDITPEAGVAKIVAWLDRESRWLRVAEAYWVAEPMAALVNAAYDSMPEQTLRHEDLPAECGFALIEGHASLTVTPEGDYDPDRTRRVGFTALSWATTTVNGEAGVQMTWWTDVSWINVDFGSTLAPESLFWPYGETKPPAGASGERDHAARWVQAFFNLMARPLVARERDEPDRATRRRAQRAGDLDPHITVITLRTPRTKSTGEARPVDWKARWLVRGFWRQQWYPSLGEHRAIWINDFIKGPADRPLRIREHVYAWRR